MDKGEDEILIRCYLSTVHQVNDGKLRLQDWSRVCLMYNRASSSRMSVQECRKRFNELCTHLPESLRHFDQFVNGQARWDLSLVEENEVFLNNQYLKRDYQEGGKELSTRSKRPKINNSFAYPINGDVTGYIQASQEIQVKIQFLKEKYRDSDELIHSLLGAAEDKFSSIVNKFDAFQ